MAGSSRKRRRVGSARTARAPLTDRAAGGTAGGKGAAAIAGGKLPTRRPMSAQTNDANASRPHKRQRSKARFKPTAAEVNAIAAHPALGFGNLRVNAHS
eukprot:COSAG02_NODE_3152_length_7273_cov_30.318372_9_plen_99_part_00